MTFQIHALDPASFAGFFALTDTELARQNMRKVTVAAKPGTPCRVSLADAEVGETVLLINHTHQTAHTPYKASHAIFVRQGVAQARPAVDEVPLAIGSRLLSIRLFDRDDMMVDADVVDGVAVALAIGRAFDDPAVAYIHLHHAKQGCFAAEVRRA